MSPVNYCGCQSATVMVWFSTAHPICDVVMCCSELLGNRCKREDAGCWKEKTEIQESDTQEYVSVITDVNY